MSRKFLNDVRCLLSKKGYINTHRIVNEDLSRPNNYNIPRTSSRYLRTFSRSEFKNSLANAPNKNKKIY
jgi:hypothetical protein